jgi:hypothetical protein
MSKSLADFGLKESGNVCSEASFWEFGGFGGFGGLVHAFDLPEDQTPSSPSKVSFKDRPTNRLVMCVAFGRNTIIMTLPSVAGHRLIFLGSWGRLKFPNLAR